MKKILVLNGFILAGIISVSILISIVTELRLTDLLFIGGMIILALSAAYLVLARREMRKSVKQKSKEEKKKYKENFQLNEKYAFVLFGTSIILFIASFILTLGA